MSAVLNMRKRRRRPGAVGWVERSETHHGSWSAFPPMMGFAALNPSYKELAT
jgi:hypothetical protein